MAHLAELRNIVNARHQARGRAARKRRQGKCILVSGVYSCEIDIGGAVEPWSRVLGRGAVCTVDAAWPIGAEHSLYAFQVVCGMELRTCAIICLSRVDTGIMTWVPTCASTAGPPDDHFGYIDMRGSPIEPTTSIFENARHSQASQNVYEGRRLPRFLGIHTEGKQ